MEKQIRKILSKYITHEGDLSKVIGDIMSLLRTSFNNMLDDKENKKEMKEKKKQYSKGTKAFVASPGIDGKTNVQTYHSPNKY